MLLLCAHEFCIGIKYINLSSSYRLVNRTENMEAGRSVLDVVTDISTELR